MAWVFALEVQSVEADKVHVDCDGVCAYGATYTLARLTSSAHLSQTCNSATPTPRKTIDSHPATSRKLNDKLLNVRFHYCFRFLWRIGLLNVLLIQS